MSLPKSRTELKGMLLVARTLRFLRPVLGLCGVKLDKTNINDIIKLGETLLLIADRFNPVFASRGWIACNALSTDAAEAALAAAGERRWTDADQILADAYSPFMVRIHVRQLRGLRCFRNRSRLAELALDDYEAERYHACVPVTLALLDGMGQELTGANFFRNTRRINSKESFLNIGPGVAALIQTMSAPRNWTTTEAISLPLRHGILHGTDLAYDNRIVAAKAWAALIAVGHYASDYLAPEPPPERTLAETIQSSVELRKRIAEMESARGAWRGRDRAELERLVTTKQFSEGTPEGTALVVLQAWRGKKFGVISQHCVERISTDHHSFAGKIRGSLGPGPDDIRILAIEDESSAMSSVKAALCWGEETDEIELRFAYHKDDDWAPRTLEGGAWLLLSLWPLESARSATMTREPGPGAA